MTKVGVYVKSQFVRVVFMIDEEINQVVGTVVVLGTMNLWPTVCILL